MGKALHRLTVGGGHHGVCIPDEQPPAGLLFQFADVLADGGLAEIQAAASFAEAAGLGDGELSSRTGSSIAASAYHVL